MPKIIFFFSWLILVESLDLMNASCTGLVHIVWTLCTLSSVAALTQLLLTPHCCTVVAKCFSKCAPLDYIQMCNNHYHHSTMLYLSTDITTNGKLCQKIITHLLPLALLLVLCIFKYIWWQQSCDDFWCNIFQWWYLHFEEMKCDQEVIPHQKRKHDLSN